MEVPCFGTLYSEYPASTHDVVKNLQLTQTLLDKHGIVRSDLFCDRFYTAHVVIKSTNYVEHGVGGTFDGRKITIGNDMDALLHEELHFIDFLNRNEKWMEHIWSESYLAAEAEYEATKNRVCFSLDGEIVCQIINVTVK